MAGKVITLDTVTRLNLPPDRIIEAAKGKLKEVVILGYDEDGQEYFASSIANGPDVVWLMERLKKQLLSVGD
jgi:hypothetical protein